MSQRLELFIRISRNDYILQCHQRDVSLRNTTIPLTISLHNFALSRTVVVFCLSMKGTFCVMLMLHFCIFLSIFSIGPNKRYTNEIIITVLWMEMLHSAVVLHNRHVCSRYYFVHDRVKLNQDLFFVQTINSL